MQHQQKTQLAQRFSQLSDLTTKQQESLSRLSRFLDERPLPPHFQTTESTQTPAEAEVEVEAEPELFLPQQQQQQQPTTIDTLAQFHEWFSEVESAAQSAVSTLESDSESDPQKAALAATLAIEYPRLNPQGAGTAAVAAAAGSRALQGYACEVARAQGLAERWEGLVRETSAHCVLVRERASSIRERACAMSAAQAESEALAEALETRIRYFDQLYPLTRRLYAPGGAVAAAAAAATANTSSTNGRKSDGTGLGNTLEELDQCVDFMQTHRSYKEAEAYLTKYRQLQARALTALKTHVVETLRGATTAIEQQQQLADSQAASAQRMRTAPSSSSRQQVLAQQQLAMQADRHIGSANSSAAGGPLPRLLPDNLDAAPLSLQFRILAARLRPQCAELEKRAVGREYGALLGDCHSCYFHQRKVLLQARVQETLRWLAGDGGNSSSSNSNDLPGAVRAATAFALRVCRAEMALFGMFFHTETPLLAKLVESIAQSLQFVLRPLLIRAKHIDLLCAAAVVLRDDSLAGPDADGPLRPLAAALSALAKDAQERITYLAQCVIRDEIAFFTPSDDDLNYPEKLLALQALSPKTSPSGDDQADLLETVQRMYATWYPSLQRTLMLLSKIYLTVDVKKLRATAITVSQCFHFFCFFFVRWACSKGLQQRRLNSALATCSAQRTSSRSARALSTRSCS